MSFYVQRFARGGHLQCYSPLHVYSSPKRCLGTIQSLKSRHFTRNNQLLVRAIAQKPGGPQPKLSDNGKEKIPVNTSSSTSTDSANAAGVEDSNATTAAAAGSLFGAIALITGSSVGAGMLALPAVTANAGLIPSCTALCATWAVLTLEALLMAEVNMAVRDPAIDSPDTIITLRQMAERTLGNSGKAVTVIYLLLSYSLLVAYLTKASEVLDFFIGGSTALPPALAASALTAAMAALLLSGSDAADRLNQALTSVLFFSFLGILVAGLGQADIGAALVHGPERWEVLGSAAPIMFLSLVYHDLVPFLCSYLEGDRVRIRQALVLGSLVPLGMFLSWEAVALGLLPSELSAPQAALQVMLPLTAASSGTGILEVSAAAAAVSTTNGAVGVAVTQVIDAVAPIAIDPLEVFVRRSGPVIGTVLESFSFLAVMTSFIGTTLGLSETLRSEIPPLLEESAKKINAASVEPAKQWTNRVNALIWKLQGKHGRDATVCSIDKSVSASESSIEDTSLSSMLGVDDDNVALTSIILQQQPEQQQAVLDKLQAECAITWNEDKKVLNPTEDNGRAIALMLCLLPPLAFTAYNPGSFLAVLSVAGGYGMTLLYGLLPPMMAWRLRTQQQQEDQSVLAEYHPLVPGGQPVLMGLFATAAAVEIGRAVADAGMLFQSSAAAAVESSAGGLATQQMADLVEAAVGAQTVL